ncbi:MAG: trypsin-like peptidase domain-containing protein [Clostridia bacterium]|nr:trypsin-like peptidase domain-containing protein [Clostridia bacterium]
MAIIPQFYSDAVVAIGLIDNQGNKIWVATGFIVTQKNELDEHYAFLATNKHVLDDGCKQIILRFNIPGKIDSKDYAATLINSDGIKNFSVHAESDVACMYINGSVLNADLGDISAFNLEEFALSREQMIENDVIDGSIVYSLGFPYGLVGVDSKVPLCRMGCISKIKEPYSTNGYLLDIQNFPGSSGSPVINRIEANHLKGTNGYNSTRLIGIMSSYIPYRDILISRQTGKEMQIVQENSGIAVAYDVNSIKETLDIEFARVKVKAKIETKATYTNIEHKDED